MPHPKKGSPEAKAIGERLKAARQAKKSAETIVNNPPQVDQNNVAALLKRIEELEKNKFFASEPSPVSQAPSVTERGFQGVIQKASLDPKNYPNPIDRLFEEQRLILKGFTRDWFDLSWSVGKVNSETYEGFKMVQPKFVLELIKILEDDAGEPSNKRFVVCSGTFFEDADAFVAIANQYGLDVPETLKRDFMDEMRYLEIRDWLLEAFYPPRPSQPKSNKKEMVIGNRLVEVFEINSETSEVIPFDKLVKKL